MGNLRLKSTALVILLVSVSISVMGQQREAVLGCKPEVFAGLKPLPKLNYPCRPDQPNDYDEQILMWPERIKAIRDYMLGLETLNGRDWWESAVSDLNLCYFRGEAGPLTPEETEKFRVGDYPINLFGNNQIRLILTPDPCYQTGYGGSNAFLLYRRGGRVVATQVLDGYFSRADNSVALDFARLGREQLIEIATTTGGLNPYTTNHYFVLDKRTGRAVPKRIFKEGKGLTNKITSVLILDDGTFPRGYPEMEIVRGNRLAQRFYTYEDAGDGSSIKDASGRSLQRRVYKWNGQYYSRIR